MEPSEIFERQRTEFRRMRELPHNVVFLDVDGVLNTLSAKERSPGIQESKVRILHTILTQNDAVLVLTTSSPSRPLNDRAWSVIVSNHYLLLCRLFSGKVSSQWN